MPMGCSGDSERSTGDVPRSSLAPRNHPAATALRVLIVDDHQLVRRGLEAFLLSQPGIEVVGEAADGRQAIDQARRLKPELVLMDVSMPVVDGIEATRQIKAEMPDVRVIGLSMCDEADVALRMRMAGADLFLRKDVPLQKILDGIAG